MVLLLVGLLSGIVTSISPCVLPVLPVVLTAGAQTGEADGTARAGRRRSVLVVVGLVTSFGAATLLGSVVLSSLGLPQDLLRNLGIAVLMLVAIGLIVPQLGELLEKPFARLGRGRAPKGSGLGLGLGLGLLYVPCAGPVLATIAVVGATHDISWRAVLLTLAFAVGAGIPLLVLALAGDAVTRRVSALRRRAPALRIGSGVVIIVLAGLIAFNLTDGLQTHVPGYTASLQKSIEQNSSATSALATVRDSKGSLSRASGDLGGACTQEGTYLENCGRAPNFTGISAWLNTPDGKPLTMASLRGKVVLIDFWTYSCINCLRTLPHVEAWYKNYAHDGLVVVGVHTPEFAFEHVESNVRSQASSLGVKYPVAIDNDYGTWNAFHNMYWPAEYLIDAQGNVRHETFGEGDYGGTENLIRQLLHQANPSATLGAATDVPAADLDGVQTPETYLGSFRGSNNSEQEIGQGTLTYQAPSDVPQNSFALSGRWQQTDQYLQPVGGTGELLLQYQATHVYLVMGGSGTVAVTLDGKPVKTVTVAGVPKLYDIIDSASSAAHLLRLQVSSGVQAYSFTFG